MIMSRFILNLALALSAISFLFLFYCTLELIENSINLFTITIIGVLSGHVLTTLVYLRRLASIRGDSDGDSDGVITRSFVLDDLLTIFAAITVSLFVFCTILLINSRIDLNIIQQLIIYSMVVGLGAFVIWPLAYFHRLAFPPPNSDGSVGDTAPD